MWKKLFATSVVVTGIFASFYGGNASAYSSSEPYMPGEQKDFYSGDIDVCVLKTGGYTGGAIVANVSDGSFGTQLSFSSFSEDERCVHVLVPSEGGGTNYVSYYTPMGLGDLLIEKEALGDTRKIRLNLNSSSKLNKYISSDGFFDNRIIASKIGVQFDANGGTGSMPAMTNLDIDTSFTLDSNTFSRAGYRFSGWNTEADGSGESYVDGATVTLAQGGVLKLYAQWAKKISTTATLRTGAWFNVLIKNMVNGTSSTDYEVDDTAIKTLQFVDELPTGVVVAEPYINLAIDGSLPVYATHDGAGNVYIFSDADIIYANESSAYMFSKMQALTTLTLSDKFDTSRVTNMDSMFRNTQSLTSLALPESFNTANVTSMWAMFNNMYSLTSLTFPSNFDTSKVVLMYSMFENLRSLESLTLPNGFDTSNAENMERMFYNMRSLQSLVLPDSFNTSKVTSMKRMFAGMLSLTSLTLPNSFIIASGTTTTEIFASISNAAILYAADATAQSLWPGVLGN